MIEKNIFQTWYTKKLPLDILEKVESLKKMNPEYSYHLYDNDDMDRFVLNNFKGIIYECYNKLNIIVAKVDFWRYLILYKYGGIYLDIDSFIEKPLDLLINKQDMAIISAENNPNFYVQWALIFSKKHPILEKIIELVCSNIIYNKYPNDIIKMTGSGVYSNAINIINNKLYNKKIDHSLININTDITYTSNNISYRIYSIDYSDNFIFKYKKWKVLYINKLHWSKEIRIKKLLK